MPEVTGIAIAIPVGPYPFYKQYLPETLASVRQQTRKAVDILLIDDMADLNPDDYPDCRIWRSPWRLGIPAVDNVGVALANSELVMMLSCDDRLFPNCLEMCWQAWTRYKDPLGMYWVDIEYSTGEKQALPCGRCMWTKSLWKHTGGYPPEAGVGACDHIFVNMLLEHKGKAGKLYHVEGGPLYWHRTHPNQYTQNCNCHPETIADIRTVFAQRWRSPEWGRLGL